MVTNQNPIKQQADALKKLMGGRWSTKLMELTGLSRQAVHQMVSNMNTSHEHWHFVMDLARKGKQLKAEINELTSAAA